METSLSVEGLHLPLVRGPGATRPETRLLPSLRRPSGRSARRVRALRDPRHEVPRPSPPRRRSGDRGVPGHLQFPRTPRVLARVALAPGSARQCLRGSAPTVPLCDPAQGCPRSAPLHHGVDHEPRRGAGPGGARHRGERSLDGALGPPSMRGDPGAVEGRHRSGPHGNGGGRRRAPGRGPVRAVRPVRSRRGDPALQLRRRQMQLPHRRQSRGRRGGRSARLSALE